MKPPGRDIKTVKQQLDDIGRFYKRLEKADDLVGLTERAAESLIDSGHSVDSAKTRDQVQLISTSETKSSSKVLKAFVFI